MTRETYKLVVAIGVLINGPLYLAGCFIAGLLLGNAVAWRLALAGAGVFAWIGVAAFAAQLVWQIARLDISDPALCLRVFKSNRDAGLILFAGLLVDAVMRTNL